jgi:hypothetical protein
VCHIGGRIEARHRIEAMAVAARQLADVAANAVPVVATQAIASGSQLSRIWAGVVPRIRRTLFCTAVHASSPARSTRSRIGAHPPRPRPKEAAQLPPIFSITFLRASVRSGRSPMITFSQNGTRSWARLMPVKIPTTVLSSGQVLTLEASR